MEEKYKNLPLRIGVGVVLLNKENKVFVAKRIDNPKNFWQMPQGGVDEGEDFLSAAYRELEEETFVKSVLPSEPPGWSFAKSSFTNPLASSSVIANASPRTNIAVVLDVGARFIGQASLFTLVLRTISLFFPLSLIHISEPTRPY